MIADAAVVRAIGACIQRQHAAVGRTVVVQLNHAEGAGVINSAYGVVVAVEVQPGDVAAGAGKADDAGIGNLIISLVTDRCASGSRSDGQIARDGDGAAGFPRYRKPLPLMYRVAAIGVGGGACEINVAAVLTFAVFMLRMVMVAGLVRSPVPVIAPVK